MFEKAEALQTLYAFEPAKRWKWKMALRRGDRDVVRELTHWASKHVDQRRVPWFALNLAILGYPADAEQLLDGLPEGFDVEAGQVLGARGVIHFARQDYEDAIPLLEEAIPLLRYQRPLGDYFHAVRTLSRAWEALGQPGRGLAVLEEASRQKSRFLVGRVYWMELQLRLAELYREVGRNEEALEIEDELRRYCAYADPDFPVLQELELRGRSLTGPQG